MTPKTLGHSRRFTPARTQIKQCGVCGKSTREGKPYCPDDIEYHPYVQGILRTIEKREKEIKNVEKEGQREVDINGSVAQEILSLVNVNGGRTIARLARDLNRAIDVMTHYAKALSYAGFFVITENARGYLIVTIKGN